MSNCSLVKKFIEYGVSRSFHHANIIFQGVRQKRQTLLFHSQNRYLSQIHTEERPERDDKGHNVSDAIFEMLKDKDHDQNMKISSLQNALLTNGVRWKSDPRLKYFRTQLSSWKKERETADLTTFRCTSEELFKLIGDHGCLRVLAKTLGRQSVIPDFETFGRKIKGIFETVSQDDSGALATYIPQLAKEDPTKFGLSLCTVDGQRIDFGDADVPFCLQSCVKPFQYAIAVSNHTSRHVHEQIGKEPSGSLFNAIVLNDDDQPHNPMINAGALVVCSLLKPELAVAERYVHVQGIISEMAASEYTSFHNAVFQSEKATSYRNFSLAYLLKEKNCFAPNVSLEETVDLYLQLCALKMTCSSASVAAATLANGGVCPLLPDKRMLNSVAVRNTLSLMHSCGIQCETFSFQVGLPAKSGVAGGLMLVIPNVMGIMIWSPLLDEKGNSERGIRFCKELVRQCNFHAYDNLRYSERKSDPRVSIVPLTDAENNLLSAAVLLGEPRPQTILDEDE